MRQLSCSLICERVSQRANDDEGQVWSLCVNNDETFLSRHRTLNYWAVGVSSLLTQREVDAQTQGVLIHQERGLT